MAWPSLQGILGSGTSHLAGMQPHRAAEPTSHSALSYSCMTQPRAGPLWSQPQCHAHPGSSACSAWLRPNQPVPRHLWPHWLVLLGAASTMTRAQSPVCSLITALGKA